MAQKYSINQLPRTRLADSHLLISTCRDEYSSLRNREPRHCSMALVHLSRLHSRRAPDTTIIQTRGTKFSLGSMCAIIVPPGITTILATSSLGRCCSLCLTCNSVTLVRLLGYARRMEPTSRVVLKWRELTASH
jgi:hypothetical protein